MENTSTKLGIKKRSVIIVLLGILAIAFSLFWFTGFFNELQSLPERKAVMLELKNNSTPPHQRTGLKVAYFFACIFRPSIFALLGLLWFLAGIGVFRNKNWGRKCFMLSSCLTILTNILSLKGLFIAVKNLPLESPILDVNQVRNSLNYEILTHAIMILIFALLLFYLTRPRVKEQFK
ncbi:hypothetical protein ACFL38_02225 [Candidatus Omnitrophota bacterium]